MPAVYPGLYSDIWKTRAEPKAAFDYLLFLKPLGARLGLSPGALGGTRTPTILLTATSRQRVYQFRHERLGRPPRD